MTNMISVSAGFQTSVNIAFDLNDNSKIQNYIPTKSALSLLEDVLMSTSPKSTDRARILIGAYGKGKSHIILMILSILMKKDLNLFQKMMPKVNLYRSELFNLIQHYYNDSNNKLLPVVVSGASNSIEQAFMLALERTLYEYGLSDIMPDTNYKAAINTIYKWKKDFPNTYSLFEHQVNNRVKKFIKRLEQYDPSAYAEFEKLYPSLTSGSSFNPFVGFEVSDLYYEVVKSLKIKGYSGIYVVYDEFSKYLENHISDAIKNDTKILQTFAEKCCRSESFQLHVMLICHKEITSYIDRASKSMVDGWRGVSERFRHIYLNNSFSQTYEIIASAIEKDQELWESFKSEHVAEFRFLMSKFVNHAAFSDFDSDSISKVIYECYPLHPISTFILPRLSEQVAQNERTLFTFISSRGEFTLSHFLLNSRDDVFTLVTPDLIYDYFEPLLKQEVYSGNLHKYYVLASSILRKIDESSLEAKIVKTLALIYILEHFEKLKPTIDILLDIFLFYGQEVVHKAVKSLIEDKYVVYLKRSNNYLQLKESSGVDIRAEISKQIEKFSGKLDVKSVLNNSNFEQYLYPSRYNDQKDMTRYFDFQFVDESEVTEETKWNLKRECTDSDGVIYAIITGEETNLYALTDTIRKTTKDCDDCLFILPRKIANISSTVAEFNAVETLMQAAVNDPVLVDDYQIIYEDLQDVIRRFINGYVRPENNSSCYYYRGREKIINRKSELSNTLSDICDELYSLTPVINNEVINKKEITSVTRNSRHKVISGLLCSELNHDLGLYGTGQDISIMRSTLLNTGILVQNDTSNVHINLVPDDNCFAHMLNIIEQFVQNSRTVSSSNFIDLYRILTGKENHIGIRKGLIPIYIAAVLHKYKNSVVINCRSKQVPLTSDTLEQINADPNIFSLSYIDWNNDKEVYISELEVIFGNYLNQDINLSSYEKVLFAMKRWYMELPKYTKNTKLVANSQILSENHNFVRELLKCHGAYEFIFNILPSVYGSKTVGKNLTDKIRVTKDLYDNALTSLKYKLIDLTKEIFFNSDNSEFLKMSLTSVVQDFTESLDDSVFDQLFSDGTEKCLNLFKSVTNDEETFISKVAKMATGLRLEDWNDDTPLIFEKKLKQVHDTAKKYNHSERFLKNKSVSTGYELTFHDDQGNSVTKRFDRVEDSKKGKLLYNSIMSQIDAMGQSITDQEKRQILIDVLKTFCS